MEEPEERKAYESIINHCDEIKFLNISFINYNNIPKLYELITHLNEHLQYLSLQHYYNLNVGSMILTELGQILPDPLKYLELSFKIDPNDLKILLGHCKLIELKTLLVRNFNHKNVDVTFNILKEFVRERKVRNFAY